jgi:hypothetical protein
MGKFKKMDAWTSVMLIMIFCLICLINQELTTLFVAYFVVGGWQVISMLAHLFNRRYLETSTARSVYHGITLISVVTMPGSFYILLFVAPFMAIFYTWLCFSEVKKMNQRPLDLLK